MKLIAESSSLKSKISCLPENAKGLLSTLFYALAASLTAVAFMFLTNLLFSRTFGVLAAAPTGVFVFGSLAVIVVTSAMVGWLLNVYAPEAAGSGIPQMKAGYWRDLGYLPAASILVKFIAGVISIGGGTSLGREGPSVYIGAGTASNLSGLFGVDRRRRRAPSITGGSAGLAAAFNSPLAAITFAIEEITGELNNRFLGSVVLASVVGAFVVHAVLGRQPAFSLPPVENVSWAHYLVVPVVAFIASVGGVIFHQGTLFLREKLLRRTRISKWHLPVCGGIITWLLGVSVFLTTGKLGVFGLGYQDLSAALRNDFPWKVAGLIMIAKLLATIVSYAFGGCGGIFAPMLFCGGMAGYFIAGLAARWINLTPADHVVLTVVGMSACLGALVRAPLTSILIVFEMTHQFSLVPGLLLGMVISQSLAKIVGHLNFYDALLVQDGHELHKVRPPKDLESWLRLPVVAIANPRPVLLRDLSRQELEAKIKRYPYNVFPVVLNGRLVGLLSRQSIIDYLRKEGSSLPEIQKAVTCFPDQTVNEIGDKFIASPVNVLVVVDRDDGSIKGIITMHDLIRAQVAMTE